MRLIRAVALQTPVGRLLAPMVEEFWDDWVDVVSTSAFLKKYVDCRERKHGGELTRLEIAEEVAKEVFVDACWGYGLDGWGWCDRRAYQRVVERGGGYRISSTTTGMPQEYQILETWLEGLVSAQSGE